MEVRQSLVGATIAMFRAEIIASAHARKEARPGICHHTLTHINEETRK